MQYSSGRALIRISILVAVALAVVLSVLAAYHPAGAGSGPAVFAGRIVWESDKSYFGGFSGLEVAQDGLTFMAIGDNAQIVSGRLLRKDGELTGVSTGPIGALKGTDGVELFRSEEEDLNDSEGLALLPDGSFYVSFERRARVWRYRSETAPAEALPAHDDFQFEWTNASFEALAVDADGDLYTLPERWQTDDTPYPVYQLRGGSWSIAFELPRQGKFRATGADFGPDGALYLLERRFLPPFGFRSRVRRIRFDASGVIEDRVLLESSFREHDNLEGIAVWRDASGDIRLTMISDDNYSFLQVTEIVEYRVPASLVDGGEGG